jgi:hypothetical protein
MRTANWYSYFLVVGAMGAAVACSSDDGEGGGSAGSDEFIYPVGLGGARTSGSSCPLTQPAAGNSCTVAGLDCPYGDAQCTCDGTSWECTTNSSGSGGNTSTNPDGCPSDEPEPDGTCSMTTFEACLYGLTACVCVNSAWTCGEFSITCPEAPPEDGGSCNYVLDGSCDYGSYACTCEGTGLDMTWDCTGEPPGTGGAGGATGAGGEPGTAGTAGDVGGGGEPGAAGEPGTAGTAGDVGAGGSAGDQGTAGAGDSGGQAAGGVAGGAGAPSEGGATSPGGSTSDGGAPPTGCTQNAPCAPNGVTCTSPSDETCVCVDGQLDCS